MRKGYFDLITRIRNGYMARLDSVFFIHTKRNIGFLSLIIVLKIFNVGLFFLDISKDKPHLGKLKLFLKEVDVSILK